MCLKVYLNFEIPTIEILKIIRYRKFRNNEIEIFKI